MVTPPVLLLGMTAGGIAMVSRRPTATAWPPPMPSGNFSIRQSCFAAVPAIEQYAGHMPECLDPPRFERSE
ncbi:hypothetical protein [Ralstonia solanacearum]|uniref:hypothetical protein n=1 Tax=Ralstonia solanacearum TaxID=305 RepID=UPI00366DD8F8